MNRSEIREIRRLLTIKYGCITRLCGCYVDGEKEIRSRWERFFPSLQEDEGIKYLDILRKALSGGLGKDMVNMELRKGDSGAGILWKTWKTQTKDDGELERLYEYVIGNLEYQGQFAILVAYGNYDIPGKAKDGQEMEDGSDEVYEFVLSCVCPVNRQKPGLAYDPDEGGFKAIYAEKMLSDPVAGILYPAFNDRSQDMDAALCYVRNMCSEGRKLVERLTGDRITLSAAEEQAAYMGIIEEVLGRSDATMAEVRRIEERLQRLKKDHDRDAEPYGLGVEEMALLLRDSEIDEERIGRLEEAYAREAGAGERLTIDNLGHKRALTMEMEEGRLELDLDHAYKVAIRELEGKNFLIMPLQGNVEVNGIRINMGLSRNFQRRREG